MPTIEMSALPDDARIWIFGISPTLDEAGSATLLSRIDTFLGDWAAHGTPITSARQVMWGSFLIVGIDKKSEASGCSIDRMFALLRQIEDELFIEILNSDRIFVRHGDGHVDAITRGEFSESGDYHTIVFNTAAERLEQVRSGAWERRAEESWHRALLTARS
jgi:hypothetical protein